VFNKNFNVSTFFKTLEEARSTANTLFATLLIINDSNG
jgi:hypothetical protein